MNQSKGGVLNSPAFRANSRRLDSDSLGQLPGAAINQTDEQASHRSKRSLSINTNKVAKVVRLGEDSKSAISKVKQRTGSRGVNGNGHQRNATIEKGIYHSGLKLSNTGGGHGNLQINSTEDLKSQASQGSFVKDMLA